MSALAAAGLATAQVAIEIVGVGIAGIPVPTTVEGWYSLLQEHRILGLTELTGLQIPVFALLIPVFLALRAALNRADEALVLLATTAAIVGIGVYLASNTALSMLTLSDRYAAAATDAHRTALLAAGEAMLATYEGPGLDAGVSLVMLAVLALSVVMLRSHDFGRATASLGFTASAISLAYYAGVSLPSERIFFLEAAAGVFILWVLLVGRALLRLARA